MDEINDKLDKIIALLGRIADGVGEPKPKQTISSGSMFAPGEWKKELNAMRAEALANKTAAMSRLEEKINKK